MTYYKLNVNQFVYIVCGKYNNTFFQPWKLQCNN